MLYTTEGIRSPLKYDQGVAHFKEHDVRFKQPKWSGEGSLPIVLWFDEDVVIPPLYVKFGEDQWSLEFIDKVRNKEKRVGIFDHVGVEIPIVLAGL